MQTLLCTLATLSDPDGTYGILAYRTRIAACDQEEGIGFRSILLTGLYRFTLSHCGSRTPLPTLKPHLAASAPRLCTGCLLGFTGCGLSPHCIVCTEPAHPHLHYSTDYRKKQATRSCGRNNQRHFVCQNGVPPGYNRTNRCAGFAMHVMNRRDRPKTRIHSPSESVFRANSARYGEYPLNDRAYPDRPCSQSSDMSI